MTDQEKKKYLEESEELISEGSENKTELANRIAEQSRRMANTYQHIEDGFLRIIRWFSTFIDRILFNRKNGKMVALVLAILMYVVVNYNTMASVYTSSLRSTRSMRDIAVTARYNTDTFELSGLPATADIYVTGEAANVINAVAGGGTVVADLEGLTEGSHEVRLSGEGFGDSVTVVVDPSVVNVTLKKKTTQQFDLSWDFINRDKMESVYSVGTPVFDYTKVNVRASRDTLDSIAFVKALIDVGGQAADFEQDARLVAYDSTGAPVKADIVPDTVHVSVAVTSPNKTVPIEIQVSGDVPDGKAIETITADQQTVTIYGAETVLSGIDKVVVTLNASTITKDSTILRPIVLPAGVNSSNINQITMNVTVGEGVTRTIDNVPINYRNNVNNYKASQPENKTTTSVTVFGTKTNIEQITVDDINVYVDMKDAIPGLQEFQLLIDQPADRLVRYSLNESTYELNVLGETNIDTDDSGSDSNNG
ncbi:MAG: CdaR family protein [Erysipelotrichaceae bacterium]|nr:CdaR family protein [Erysipelotrichaceae bacterium]